jgi:hypothetical protein
LGLGRAVWIVVPKQQKLLFVLGYKYMQKKKKNYMQQVNGQCLQHAWI